MHTIPKVLFEVEIFKPGDIYIFCEFEDKKHQPDPVELLYTVRCETDIIRGLEFDINYIEEHELLGIVACERLSDSCVKLVLVVQVEEEVEERKMYLHRLLTTDQMIEQTYKKYANP